MDETGFKLRRKIENDEYALQRAGRANRMTRPKLHQEYIEARDAWFKKQGPPSKAALEELREIYNERPTYNTIAKYISRPKTHTPKMDEYVAYLRSKGLAGPIKLGGEVELKIKEQQQLGGAYEPVNDTEREAIIFAMNMSRRKSGLPLMNEDEKSQVIEVTNDILEAIDVISAAKGEANTGSGIYSPDRFRLKFL